MHLLKSTITCLLVFYCGFLFSQSTVFSREFPSIRSHVPIQIVNSNNNSFCVLRYNRRINDFTIERRNKSNFEIQNFSVLNLDSVNASWFDYENLDYLFFEYNKQLFFVFEKVLNEKRSIFIKQIDSAGKCGPFIELATLEQEVATSDFRFIFKRVNESQLLIVGEQYYQNSTAKKVALVYDLNKRDNKYIVKLPLENASTGFSSSFECHQNQLYYLLSNNYLSRYTKSYTVNQEILKPVFNTKFLAISSFNLETKQIVKKDFCNKNAIELKSSSISISNQKVIALLNYAERYELENPKLMFLVQAFDSTLQNLIYCNEIPIDSSIQKQLTFYDGGEKNMATEKEFKHHWSFIAGDYFYEYSTRNENDYYKEFLFWKTNLNNGKVEVQKIIPRKTFFFDGRTRFRHVNEMAIIQKNDLTCHFILENKSNNKLNPNNFNFHKFKKQKYVWGGSLVMLAMDANGNIQKQMIHKNGNMNFVPLKYEGNKSEFIYYLNKGSVEKFAILTL